MSFLDPYIAYIRVALYTAIAVAIGIAIWSYRSMSTERDVLKSQLAVAQQSLKNAVDTANANAAEIARQAKIHAVEIDQLNALLDAQKADAETSRQLDDALAQVDDAPVPEALANRFLNRFGAQK